MVVVKQLNYIISIFYGIIISLHFTHMLLGPLAPSVPESISSLLALARPAYKRGEQVKDAAWCTRQFGQPID
jgi:hypothetical protein